MPPESQHVEFRPGHKIPGGGRNSEAVNVDGPLGLPGRITAADVAIKDLVACRFPSPVAHHLGDGAMHFVGEADKVLVNDLLSDLGAHAGQWGALPAFEKATRGR